MTSRVSLLAALWAALIGCALGLYTGPFLGEIWQPIPAHAEAQAVERGMKLTFVVALKLRDRRLMHETLMAVSDPASEEYGKYLSIQELKQRFGPSDETVGEVVAWLTEALPSALVHVNAKGDMILVTSTVGEIEQGLRTKLQYHTHQFTDNTHPALRAVERIDVPGHLHEAISFVSLNSPVNNNVWSTGKRLRSKPAGLTAISVEDGEVHVEVSNKAIAMFFRATCGPTGTPNVASPPCSNLGDVPVITATFQDEDELFPSTSVRFPGSAVTCTNIKDGNECTVITPPENCTCKALINNVDQYVIQSVNVSASFSSGVKRNFGASGRFALTDVATPQFLYELYNIPYGIRVKHGSDIGLPEFHLQYYSNSDLEMFTKLSGMPIQQVDPTKVIGTDTNDEEDPGQEAQLDVEYAFAVAPDAELWFYSMADLNPYSPENEDFLAWLWVVGNQTDAPRVYSLSYADIEAAVFNESTPGAQEYAYRCDEEFLQMGLRGMSVIAGSGDDGVASFAIRTDKDWACTESRPNWPASSPYITSIGATQLTKQYLPFCQEMYASDDMALPAQCSFVGEVMCSSTIGGVIESGGGFSNIYNREEYAPWQDAFVDKYLEVEGAVPTTDGFFNKAGRGYPDISTYGSNYFVYLGGNVVRESGTSASTPVFAGMVTLWNDMRFAYGMPSMGFINPFLYSVAANHPEAYTDVTLGKNACSANRNLDDVVCCDEAFSAAAGWDAVTGLGTPKFDVIANLVLNPDAMFPSQGAMTEVDPFLCVCEDGDDGVDHTHGLAIGGLVLGLVGMIGGLGAVYMRTRQL